MALARPKSKSTPPKKTEKHPVRMLLQLSYAANETIEHLADKLEGPKSQAIRHMIKVIGVMMDEEQKGHKIVVIDKEGQQKELKLGLFG